MGWTYPCGGPRKTKTHIMEKVIIQKEAPPIFEKIKKVFNVRWENVVITYGEEIYSFAQFPKDVLIHERVHVAQQIAMGKDIWWDKYLSDKVFRLCQELEAYQVQARWIQENSPRNYRNIRLKQITMDLSSATYGNMVNFLEAKKLIGI